MAERDWADVEDHDYLNDLVGCTISEIVTGTIDGAQKWYIEVRTSRGRTLRVEAESVDGECALAFTID